MGNGDVLFLKPLFDGGLDDPEEGIMTREARGLGLVAGYVVQSLTQRCR